MILMVCSKIRTYLKHVEIAKLDNTMRAQTTGWFVSFKFIADYTESGKKHLHTRVVPRTNIYKFNTALTLPLGFVNYMYK